MKKLIAFLLVVFLILVLTGCIAVQKIFLPKVVVENQAMTFVETDAAGVECFLHNIYLEGDSLVIDYHLQDNISKDLLPVRQVKVFHKNASFFEHPDNFSISVRWYVADNAKFLCNLQKTDSTLVLVQRFKDINAAAN
jgi:hypothetical protein